MAIADILPILLASVLAWVGCLNLVAPNCIREEFKVRDARRGLSGAAMEKVRLHVRGSNCSCDMVCTKNEMGFADELGRVPSDGVTR